MNDWTLLQDYISHRSNAAFAELVRCHIGMVYGTALRQIRDPHAAQDVTQAVFILLARKAHSLSSSVVLGGWLYRTASLLSLKYLRDEKRRHTRELESSAMPASTDSSHAQVWDEIAPHLDAALAGLSPGERDGIVLRFLEQRSFRGIAEALRISEDAAKKRVTRALEKLRANLSSRGVTVTSTVLAAAIASHSLASVPESLSSLCVGNAPGNGTPVSSSIESLLRNFAVHSTRSGARWAAGAAVLVLLSLVSLNHLSNPPTSNAADAPHSGPQSTTVSTSETAAVILPAAEDFSPNALELRVERASDGAPVLDAQVRSVFYGSPSRVSQLQADSDGIFTIQLPGRASFEGMGFWIAAPGHVPLSLVWRREEADNLPRSYTVRLSEGHRLFGRVVDEQGNGVAGAKLKFNGEGTEWNRREAISYVNEIVRPLTDANGFWEGQFFPADLESIAGTVEHPAFAATTFSKKVRVTDAESLTFILQSGASVTGSVSNPEGEPVPGAQIELQDLSGWRDRRKTAANDEGHFVIDKVAEGKFAIRASAPEFEKESLVLELTKSSTNIDVVLTPVPRLGQAVLRGRLLTAGGSAIPHANVRLLSPGEPPGWSSETDSTGRFEWTYAPEGVVKLVISAREFGQKILDLEADGSEHEIRFTEPARLELKGKVFDSTSGAPVKLAKIMLESIPGHFDTGHPEWLGEAYNGAFRFRVESAKVSSSKGPQFFPHARHKVSSNALLYVEAPGYRRTTLELPRQTNDIELAISLQPGGPVTGQVLFSTQQPAPGTEIAFGTKTARAFMNEPGVFAQSHEPNLAPRATAGPDGSFDLGDAPFNATRVLAVHAHGWANAPIDSLPAEPIILQQWGRVVGFTRIAAHPAETLQISIRSQNLDPDAMGYNFYVDPDQNGRFVFERVPAGPAQVALMHRGNDVGVWSHLTTITVRTGETTNVVIGEGGVRVTGRIQLSSPRSDVDWTRSAQHMNLRQNIGSAGFDLPSQNYGFFCEPDGTFAVEAVLPGEYRLMLSVNSKTQQVDEIINLRENTLGRKIKDISIGSDDVDLGTILLEETKPESAAANRVRFY